MTSRLIGHSPARPRGGPEDAWYDEQAGPVVRLYAMTGGRATAAGHEFTVSTLVRRTGDRTEGADLSADKSAILRLCSRALSVAEIAAYLGLPLGAVEELLGDLRGAGLVRTPEEPVEGHPPIDVMQRLRDGLRTL
jgi:hypothetical protein